MLYIEGYLWDEPAAKAAIEKAMAAAKKAGSKVAFTLSDPFCVERWRSEFRELLETKIDILFANEAEAMALFEVDSFDEVLQTLRPWKGVAARDALGEGLRRHRCRRSACARRLSGREGARHHRARATSSPPASSMAGRTASRCRSAASWARWPPPK